MKKRSNSHVVGKPDLTEERTADLLEAARAKAKKNVAKNVSARQIATKTDLVDILNELDWRELDSEEQIDVRTYRHASNASEIAFGTLALEIDTACTRNACSDYSSS